MKTALKLKLCMVIVILITAAHFGSSRGWLVGNPVPGLMETLHEAENAAGMNR